MAFGMDPTAQAKRIAMARRGQQMAAQREQQSAQTGQGVGALAGGLIGNVVGGPPGAALGSALGRTVGGAIGSAAGGGNQMGANLAEGTMETIGTAIKRNEDGKTNLALLAEALRD